jgi:hypothetical protein
MTMIGTSLSIFLNAGQRGQPVHASGHDNVEQHSGGPLGVKTSYRFVSVGDRQCVVVSSAEERPQEPAHREVIVNDEHLRFLTHLT